MNSRILPKLSINADEFFVADPATLAAKRERLIIFRCIIGKKELPQKNIIATDGINRIPTQPYNTLDFNHHSRFSP